MGEESIRCPEYCESLVRAKQVKKLANGPNTKSARNLRREEASHE